MEWLTGSLPLSRQVAASRPVGVWPLGRLSSPSDTTRARAPDAARDAESGVKTEDGRW